MITPSLKGARKYLPKLYADYRFTREKVTVKKIRRSIFLHFVREMYDENNFLFHEKEKEPAMRMGCFIKGYVQDVWNYLDKAYEVSQTIKIDIRRVKKNDA